MKFSRIAGMMGVGTILIRYLYVIPYLFVLRALNDKSLNIPNTM